MQDGRVKRNYKRTTWRLDDLTILEMCTPWTSVDSVPVFVWQNPGVGGRRWLLHLQHFSSSKGRFGHLMTFEHFELCCVGLCRRYSACVNRTLHIPHKSSKANSEFYFRQFFSDHLKCGFTLLINLFFARRCRPEQWPRCRKSSHSSICQMQMMQMDRSIGNGLRGCGTAWTVTAVERSLERNLCVMSFRRSWRLSLLQNEPRPTLHTAALKSMSHRQWISVCGKLHRTEVASSRLMNLAPFCEYFARPVPAAGKLIWFLPFLTLIKVAFWTKRSFWRFIATFLVTGQQLRSSRKSGPMSMWQPQDG